MENIYAAPKTEAKLESPAVSLGKVMLALSLMVAACAVHLGVYFVSRSFAETFAAFGTDLPVITLIHLQLQNYFFVLFLPANLVLFLVLPVSQKWKRIFYVLSLAYAFLSIIVYPLFAGVALYWPVTAMSAAV